MEFGLGKIRELVGFKLEVFVVGVIVLNDLEVLHKVSKSSVVFGVAFVVSLEFADEAAEHLLYLSFFDLALNSDGFD